jgi:cardiolipin synthase
MSEPVFTIANLLTLLRMGMTPFLIILVLQSDYTAALVVFVVAGATDVLDGVVARVGHQRTRLGATLDPIADKILMSSSFIVLTWTHDLLVRIPQWLTVLTLSRDALIVVTAAVIVLTLGSRVFYPSLLGKLTTTAQVLTVGVVLVLNAQGQGVAGIEYLFLLTGLMTVASGFHYVYLVYAGRAARPDSAS